MNGIIVIDKDPGLTSHAVVAKVRKLAGQRKIGHTGTLDPDATGVLPLCLGEATKIVQFLLDGDKEYIAELILGITTDTQDASGKVLSQRPARVTQAELIAVLADFQGEILQVPPMTSAVHYQGKKLYELAHAGIEVERQSRPVFIKNLSLIEWQPPVPPRLHITCSKGTYIRTLCHDIGQKLGCGAHMGQLCRLRSGPFTLDQAHKLAALDPNKLERFLLPIQAGLPDFPVISLTPTQAALVSHGGRVQIPNPLSENTLVRLEHSGVLLAIGQSLPQGWVKPIRVFNWY